jgi:hypothetical protein
VIRTTGERLRTAFVQDASFAGAASVSGERSGAVELDDVQAHRAKIGTRPLASGKRKRSLRCAFDALLVLLRA